MFKDRNRTWAEISLGTLEYNFKQISKAVKGAKVLCILKANAYGHGSVSVARRLRSAGANYFGVATVGEALDLRNAGIDTPILILGYIDEDDACLIAQYDITASLYDFETAEVLSRAAKTIGKNIKVHIKVDTGMTRLGFPTDHPEEQVKIILKAAQLPGLVTEGIFTHFAVADESSKEDYTMLQLERFLHICAVLEESGLNFPIKHCANSGAVLQYDCTYFNMVRAGIILYGYYPDSSIEKTLDIRPAMTLKSHVVQVRDVPAGTPISYGCQYTTDRPSRIAVISIGYADGLMRSGSGRAKVLICGKAEPIMGRICMDMCMVDVTDLPDVKRGDEVVIFGNGPVNADTLAAATGTISYEVLCAVSHRVPRIFID